MGKIKTKKKINKKTKKEINKLISEIKDLRKHVKGKPNLKKFVKNAIFGKKSRIQLLYKYRMDD